MRVELRYLTTHRDLTAVRRLEQEVWGPATEAAPVDLLVALVQEGGCVVGAAVDGSLVAAAYGFPTSEPGVFHSHAVGVRPSHRGRGLARRLKHAQRDWCRERGYRVMRWTFDPLQAANAHLNLSVLGAVGVAYHVDLYGALGGINAGLPSDRLTVEWDLTDTPRHWSGERHVDLPDGPATISAREQVRSLLQPLVESGWWVTGFESARRRYRLARPAEREQAPFGTPTSDRG